MIPEWVFISVIVAVFLIGWFGGIWVGKQIQILNQIIKEMKVKK